MAGGGVVLREEGIEDGLGVGEGGGDDGEEAVEVGFGAEVGGEGHFWIRFAWKGGKARVICICWRMKGQKYGVKERVGWEFEVLDMSVSLA